MYFEPGAPEDAASAMIAAMIRGKITRRVVALELAARKLLAAEGGGAPSAGGGMGQPMAPAEGKANGAPGLSVGLAI